MDLTELRATMEGHGAAWSSVLAEGPDPDAVLVRHRDDGSETAAPASIRLAQALHHGTDHRGQICTALTTLGVAPPLIECGTTVRRPAASPKPNPRPDGSGLGARKEM